MQLLMRKVTSIIPVSFALIRLSFKLSILTCYFTAYAPNVKPVKHEELEYDPVEDWEVDANYEGFSISGNAHSDMDRTAYDVIEEYQDSLQESILKQNAERKYMPVHASG